MRYEYSPLVMLSLSTVAPFFPTIESDADGGLQLVDSAGALYHSYGTKPQNHSRS